MYLHFYIQSFFQRDQLFPSVPCLSPYIPFIFATNHARKIRLRGVCQLLEFFAGRGCVLSERCVHSQRERWKETGTKITQSASGPNGYSNWVCLVLVCHTNHCTIVAWEKERSRLLNANGDKRTLKTQHGNTYVESELVEWSLLQLRQNLPLGIQMWLTFCVMYGISSII